MNRRNFLKTGSKAALLGTAFLASCENETPENAKFERFVGYTRRYKSTDGLVKANMILENTI